MSLSARINGSIETSDGLTKAQAGRSFSLTPTGTKHFASVQDVGTVAETLAIADLATLRYACLVNPSDSGATVTATVAAMVLKPGDVAVFPPSTSLVTMISTSTVTPMATSGFEV